MAKGEIIVDTGPLVAFLVASDAHHAWARERFQELPPPFLTCEPVLTETVHLISRLPGGTQRFFELVASGLLVVAFELMTEREALRKLVRKYADLPMSLADACLVRMAEIREATIFTVDSQFRIYRRHGRRQIAAILP
ncbi:MAG: type II toxin-antitoxin system VapC family toxin [Candidatus Binatia bacterium]